jgi:hypothetical protein
LNQNQFVPYGPYIDIINAVGKWKIVDLKSLLELCNYKFKYSNLRKKVKTLENNGMVKCVNLGRKRKHVYLSNTGIKFTNYDKTYELTDECMNHDVIVGTALRAFLKYPSFYNGKMFHQIDENDINPDAVLSGKKGGKEYQLAIEIELTQKSSSRVKSKYSRYSRSKNFDYCIFITNKEGLIRAYKSYLNVMNKEVQSKVILMYAPDIQPSKFEYLDSECFFKNEVKTFKEVFGE